MWEGNKSQAAALESVLLSVSLGALQTCNEAIRGYLGIDTLQGRSKLKWWYKLVTMLEDIPEEVV